MKDILELTPNGDPYGSGYTASHSSDGGESWFYRGDIGAKPRWWWRRFAFQNGYTLREPRSWWWVGILSDGTRKAFDLPYGCRPEDTLWAKDKYILCIGPHATKRGALFMASWRAIGNPHCQTSYDADRIARKMYAEGQAV